MINNDTVKSSVGMRLLDTIVNLICLSERERLFYMLKNNDFRSSGCRFTVGSWSSGCEGLMITKRMRSL